jgi:hypothetical protein
MERGNLGRCGSDRVWLEHFCGSKIEIFKQDVVHQYDILLDCLAMRTPGAAAAPGTEHYSVKNKLNKFLGAPI